MILSHEEKEQAKGRYDRCNLGMIYGSDVNINDKNDPLTMIIDMVSEHSRVLDVGCGRGKVSEYLKNEKNCQMTAVELSALSAELARPNCDNLIIGSIEDEAVFQQILELSPFDYVVFADVLEHLANPWTVLKATRNLLIPGGEVLMSIPNIAHWTIRLRLACGRFDYTDGFLVDRTHLRFFTLASARALIQSSGYQIKKESIRWKPLPGDRIWRNVPRVRYATNDVLARSLPGIFGYQFVFAARANH